MWPGGCDNFRKDVGAVAEALPFVQAGIPEQGYGVGVKAGKKGSSKTPDSQLFADLMAQYAPVLDTNNSDKSAEAPDLERFFAVLKGGISQLSPEVLKLLAH